MGESFRDRLCSHLDVAQKKLADANKSADQKKREEIQYLDRFEAMAKRIIHPVLIAARDELLGRNIPAEVVWCRDEESDRPAASIALNCSNRGKTTLDEVRTSPQFKLIYLAQSMTMWCPNITHKQGASARFFCKLENIKEEQVEEDVMAFLESHNPH